MCVYIYIYIYIGEALRDPAQGGPVSQNLAGVLRTVLSENHSQRLGNRFVYVFTLYKAESLKDQTDRFRAVLDLQKHVGTIPNTNLEREARSTQKIFKIQFLETGFLEPGPPLLDTRKTGGAVCIYIYIYIYIY